MNNDPFKEYIKQTEPDKRYKGYAWSTAIGLQAVDGLTPSKYLIDTAIQNIEGDISIEEAQKRIESYYVSKPDGSDERTEEADKVATRIAEVLSENAFTFSPNEYISIHKRLFQDVYKHAGKIRDYNITKKEWVLNGASVMYGSATELFATLEYDFSQEKNFNYKNLTIDETIRHLAVFVARLWQIHIFGEGNTRTTAVFFIKYLRTLGFDVTNDIFAENAWYFRNSLVRANYNNLKLGVHETTEYLEVFLRNLLLNENNQLKNRRLHIFAITEKPDIGAENPDIGAENPDIGAEKPDIGAENPDIGAENPDIGAENPDIEVENPDIGVGKPDIDTSELSRKYSEYANRLFEKFGYEQIFGRSEVVEILGVQKSSASEFLQRLLKLGITEQVSGCGKGKYKFK